MSVRTRDVVIAVGLDVVVTLIFVLIGRGTHNADPTLVGLATAWWPFLVALALGWGVTLAWRRPFGPVWPGLGLWLITVAGGMLFRTLSGQGTALAFVIVATLSLGILLIGWRGIAVLIRRRSSLTHAPSA
ncbi:DUF3054 domain-containing protein [Mycetocola zhujimingii]|uniref:DUF3054 domain-containing protein n=1 Tax=Mycetocola zhujimingii TaxID=2079792 RepID=A0A2U1TAB3_9MICO|nr:DUF3054 domain-containing protein [Mycetocola zhujimingii]PWC04621.1 DUF3054 domain-containing protein [Mycetocola zhujimingii]